MKDLTDEQLMMLINNGDVQMMHGLFERYNFKIYNYCLKLTRNKSISEDIAQEAFYKVLKYRKSFNNKTFAPWIFTITRNLCLDYLKKMKLNELNTESLEGNIENVSYDESDKKESLEHLHNVLNQLTSIDRELIILSRYEKLKYKEIAEIMKISETAVKIRIHRALKKLRVNYFKSSENG